MSNTNPNWDIDLRDGQAGEKTVAGILSVETVEVKTDRRWHQTGNIYIERSYFSRIHGHYISSGIDTSRASHWAFVLQGMVIMIPTEDLRKIVDNYGHPIHCNIQPNPSTGVLIKVSSILDYFGGKHGEW